jgi:hypothetical protein
MLTMTDAHRCASQLARSAVLLALCAHAACVGAEEPGGTVRRDAAVADRPTIVTRADSGAGNGDDVRAVSDGGCGIGLTACNGSCRNLRTDESNCGMCGRRCSAAESCTAGVCAGAGACDAPRMTCAGRCVDTDSDPEHCGGCGRMCGAGEGCVMGSCMAGGGGGGVTGAECMDDMPCGMNALGPGYCILEFPMGYCSADCNTDADCGAGGSCLRVDGGGVCLKTCNEATPCRASYVCAALPAPAMGGGCIPDCRALPSFCPAGSMCNAMTGGCE